MKFIGSGFCLAYLLFCALQIHAVNFNSPRTVVLPSAQAAVATGNLNRDVFPDMVVGGDRLPTGGLGKIYVYIGKGNGSFLPPQVYDVGNNPSDPFPAPYIQQIKIADMNNDGNPDVVVAHNGKRIYLFNQSSTFISVLIGNENGTLQTAQSYLFIDADDTRLATCFDVADINNDGLLDVVLVVNTGVTRGAIWNLKNLGNGSFQTMGRIMLNTNIWDIAVVKVNRDRHMDFVMATTEGVVIGYGEGGSFPSTFEQRDEGILEFGVTTGDFNQDGRVDFAVTSNQNAHIRLFLNSLIGFPTNPTIYQTAFRGYQIENADLNSDGNLDLVIKDNTNATQNFQIF